MYIIMPTWTTVSWDYTCLFLHIYDCSSRTLTSINNTNQRTGYRVSTVTSTMTTRMWSTFFSDLSFDRANCNNKVTCFIYVISCLYIINKHMWKQMVFIDRSPWNVYCSKYCIHLPEYWCNFDFMYNLTNHLLFPLSWCCTHQLRILWLHYHFTVNVKKI